MKSWRKSLRCYNERDEYPTHALKRRFDLDDEYIEDPKAEIIDAKHIAADEDGKVLVWLGEGVNGETDRRIKGETEDLQEAKELLKKLA